MSLRGVRCGAVRCGVRRQCLRVRFVSPVVSEQPGSSSNYLLAQEQDFRRRLANALPLVLSHCHFPVHIPSSQQGWPWRTALQDFHSSIPPTRDRPRRDKRFPEHRGISVDPVLHQSWHIIDKVHLPESVRRAHPVISSRHYMALNNPDKFEVQPLLYFPHLSRGGSGLPKFGLLSCCHLGGPTVRTPVQQGAFSVLHRIATLG
jgi:hypothetical protein